MSVKVSSWAWHEAPESIKGNALLALLALADVADDAGRCVYFQSPSESSQQGLARKAKMSVATWRRAQDALVEAGVLEIGRDTQQSVNTYRVIMTAQSERSESVTAHSERSQVSGQSAQSERSGVSELSGHSSIGRSHVVNVPTKPSKGSRLDPDWTPSEALVTYTIAKAPSVDIHRELENFVDYWIAQPGQRGVKTDWDATWRGWVRRSHERAVERGWSAGLSAAAGQEWMQR